MDDYTESKLTDFIDRTGRDMTVEEAKPAFDEKYEEVEEKLMEDASHEQKVDYAISMLSGEDLRSKRVGGSGEVMELKILSIGHRGVWEDHPTTEQDTVTAHAIIHGPLNGKDEEHKAAKAVVMLTADNVDLLEAQQKFHALNELKGTFEVEEAWDLDGFYRAYSTDETELVEENLDDLPSDRDSKNQLLRRMFDDVELANLAQDGEGLSSYDGDTGYTHDWGADIKRFTGSIVDYFISDDREFGVYTLMDDSVAPEDVEDASVMTADGTEAHLVGDSGNVPGLTVYAQPDYHMNYGNQSIVDVYGVIEVGQDGQLAMRAAGVVPIVPTEMDDGDDADEGVKAKETSI